MSRFIPDEVIDQIRDNCNVVDLVNSYIPLKRFGPTWKACCPFHAEKTPSFTVTPDQGTYHCFGCGAHGDVFSFIMAKENVDFIMSVNLLADRMNITIPESGGGKYSNGDRKKAMDAKQKCYEIHDKVATWFENNLWNNPNSPLARYFAGRGIPLEVAKKFRIGAAPDAWDGAISFLKQQGYSETDIIDSGIVTESNKKAGHFYDRFRNRLMFSIWDEQGRVVGFSGRTIEKESKGAKYVNSPETKLFKKSRVLYALPLARAAIKEKGFVILSEGQVDTIALHMAGFENTVAPQGTAFTEDQAKILNRYTNRIHIGFDGDAAGIKAIKRAVDTLLPLGMEIRVIQFPEGQDPDDIYKQNGSEGVAYYVNNAVDFFDFVVEKLIQEHDDGTHWWKDRVVTEALKVLMKLESSIIRSSYITELSQKLQIPEETVRTEMSRHAEQGTIGEKKYKKEKKSNLSKPETYSRNQNYHSENISHMEPPEDLSGDDGYNPGEAYEPGIGYSQSEGSGMIVNPDISLEKVDKQVLDAEENLFEMALEDELLGRMIEMEFPSEMISKTPVGDALEIMIRFTMNDEWDLAEEEVKKYLESNPSVRVKTLLERPRNYDIKQKKQAVDDCIYAIKDYYKTKEVEHLSKHIDESDEAFMMYIEKRKELLEMNNKRRR